MRRILFYTRNGISAIASVAKRASLVALIAGATVGMSQNTQAQYPELFAASNSNFSVKPAAAQSANFANGIMKLGDMPSGSSTVVDGSYSGSSGNDNVKPAQYMSGGYDCQTGSGCAPYGPNACCDVTWYGQFDAMWFRREGHRRFGLTQSVFMNDPDFEFAGRYTIGKMCDCANSWELVYAGPFRWNRRADVTGAGNINSKFLANPASLQLGFDGADRHVQVLKQQLDSVEINRRWWAWDAVSTLVGLRYINYQDRYSLTSVRPPAGPAPLLASYRDDINNNMVGMQIGGNVYVPTSLRTLVSFKGKAGVFGNFTNREVRIVKDGAATLRNGVDDVDIAGIVELGINGIYEVTPSVRLIGGYEAWIVPGTATASSQRSQFLNAGTGTAVRVKDTPLFHGFSVGAQVLF